MRTIRHHIMLSREETARIERQEAPGWLGLAVCLLCLVVLGSAGCGVHPKPVASQDVSPVQLQSHAKVTDSPKTEAPQVTLGRTEPMPHTTQTTSSFSAATGGDARTEPSRQLQASVQEIGSMTAVAPGADDSAPRQALAEATAAPTPQPPTALAPVEMPALTEPGMADQPVSVNFENVDIRTVLKTIGQVTGINFIPHESVTGKVTVMSPTPIRLGEIYDFLQTILDVYGYAAIESDNAVKIVPKAEATRNSPHVRIGADPAYIPRNDALVTQIMPLRYANATEISEILKPTLSAAAQMDVYPRTKSIVITDTSANIFHAAQIIQQLDVVGSREQVLTIPLRFASAQVLSEQINRILEKNETMTPQTARLRPSVVNNQTIRVLPDERTNSVIAVANEQDIETIRQLVERLDIARPIGADNVQVAYLKNADANEVAAALQSAAATMRINGTVDATQPIQITAHASTNSLIIVASPQDYEVLSKIIDKLDIIREQVLVEARIVEVTEEALKQIGVDWATLDDVVSDSVRGFGVTNLGPRVDFLSGNLEGLAVGAWKGTASDVKIGAILHALETQSGVNILSMPKIMTTNHRKATIIVGENVPFVMGSRITETTDPATPTVIQSFEYRDVGITLEVTPHVSQGGMVRLDVDSEFTKLIEDVTATSVDTPVTAKRSAKTTVSMESGNTVIIGGLMRDDTTRVTKQVPIIGSLPLVGPLFRSQRDRMQKTNLLIFITPIVMASQEQLLSTTSRMEQQMQQIQEKGR